MPFFLLIYILVRLAGIEIKIGDFAVWIIRSKNKLSFFSTKISTSIIISPENINLSIDDCQLQICRYAL